MSALERFSTTDLAPAHRHDAWVNRGGSGIGRLVDARPNGAFDMWSEHLALGPVGLNFGEMSAQHYERTAERCRKDHVDMISLCMMLDGEMRGDAQDQDFVSGPGSLTLFDLAQPARHASTASRTVMITMPRALALTRFGSLYGLHGAVVDDDSSRLLRSHLLALQVEAKNGLNQAVVAPLGETVLDLISVALAMSGQVEMSSVAPREGALKHAAVDEIQRRLDWDGLGVDHLCGRLGLSRTQLYRLFEAEGGVQAYIRNSRLKRVHSSLSNPDCEERIVDLAARWHFSEPAQLSRAFRQAYGVSPVTIRHNRKTTPPE